MMKNTSKSPTEVNESCSSGGEFSVGNKQVEHWCVGAQGARRYMEDRSDQHLFVPENEELLSSYGAIGWFGVYDGHGGSAVAEIIHNEIYTNFTEWFTDSERWQRKGKAKPLSHLVSSVMNGFRITEHDLHKGKRVLCCCPPERFYKTGSTAAVVLVLKSHFLFVHCGDSRILLVRDNVIFYESKDHKPTRKSEMDRINATEICTVEDGWIVDVRPYLVSTKLSVSRGFGDIWFKIDRTLKWSEQPVIHTPETKLMERQKHDQFIVVASDGLWNFMKSIEVAEFVRERLIDEKKSSQEVAAELLEHVLTDRGSDDNVTITIVKLI